MLPRLYSYTKLKTEQIQIHKQIHASSGSTFATSKNDMFICSKTLNTQLKRASRSTGLTLLQPNLL